MASWSTNRQFSYFFGFIVLLAAVGALLFFFFFYKPPTCSDGKQNGSEKGVDCGGSCTRLCPADFLAPRVLWSYSMKVAPGLYNSLAYVENPNQSVEAPASPYSFKLYDSEGLLVAERKGKTIVPVGQKFAVFAGAIKTGTRIPTRTTFELGPAFEWKAATKLVNLHVLDISIDQKGQPKAEAKVRNDAGTTLSSLDAFIIIYDADGNRLAFSKTRLERIDPGDIETLYFTWPEAFPREPGRSELLFVKN